MTTPRWTKNAYVRSILAVLLILCILITFVCLNSYGAFSSSSQSSQDKERKELSNTNSLKTLVASWLKGEFHACLFYCKICEFGNEVDVTNLLMIII